MNNKSVKSWIAALLVVFAGACGLNAHAAERVTYIHFDALGSPIAGSDQNGGLVE